MVPAPTGFVKLSVDGSFSTKDNSAGSGMILRDASGATIFAACRSLMDCSSPLEAELRACDEGLKLTRQHSQLPVIIESDSSILVEAVNSSTPDRSAFHYLVKDILAVASLDSPCSFVKVCRSQVRVSDALASYARVQSRTMTWLGLGPECIHRLLALDNIVTPPVE